MPNNSDHWCAYYHNGLYIGANAARETEIAMCCWQQKTPIVDAVRFDHPKLESIRQQAHTGIPRECSPYCGMPGHIANERERSQQEAWGQSASGKIKKLHLEQSLACNLTCISCSSRYSSAWSAHYHLFDSQAAVIRLKKEPQRVWQHLDFSELEHVHFTGGEPLMNPDNLLILQHLRDIGRLGSVSLSYCTNGTLRPDPAWLDLWQQAQWVRLFFSLDGTASTFEYTRYPASWSEVTDNIQWFRSQRHICILIEVDGIIGIHNIFNLPDFFAWWKAHCQTGSQGDASQIFVRAIDPNSHGGRVLDLRYLPGRARSSAEHVLQSASDCPGALGLRDRLCQVESGEWLDYLERLDQLRGTNWRQQLTLAAEIE